MNKIFFASLAIMLLCFSGAQAQFSISTSESDLQGSVVIDTLSRVDEINNPYFSRAKWLAEKMRIRKERNTTEFKATLQLSQTSFDNWESGGNNTFSGRSTVSFSHVFKKEKMTISSGFNARYGLNVIDSESFKNEDEFTISWKMAWDMLESWSYGGSFNLRSQFAHGYKSRTDETLISSFMSPGYMDVALGFNYKRDGSPFEISLSPVTGNMVLVLSDTLSKKGVGGVEAGKHSKSKLGPSVRINFDKKFGKNELIRLKSNLYSFSDLKSDPIVRWENTLDFSPTRYLTTTLYILSYYDKTAVTPRPQQVQFKYSISVGLSYTLSNK